MTARVLGQHACIPHRAAPLQPRPDVVRRNARYVACIVAELRPHIVSQRERFQLPGLIAENCHGGLAFHSKERGVDLSVDELAQFFIVSFGAHSVIITGATRQGAVDIVLKLRAPYRAFEGDLLLVDAQAGLQRVGSFDFQ